MTRRVRLDIEYDGTGFAGWQIQPGQRTVQGELGRALTILAKTDVRVVGSGRTDAGVHAREQVAHADVPVGILDDAERLRRSVQGIVGPEIAIRRLTCVPADFHARFSARERRYCYRIALLPHALTRQMEWLHRGRLDVEEMTHAAGHFVGQYPATSFAAAHADDRDAVVDVRTSKLENRGELLEYEITADRFVTHMVRIIVGTLVEVGRGRRGADSIPELVRARDRTLAGATAPPHGLCLEHVEY